MLCLAAAIVRSPPPQSLWGHLKPSGNWNHWYSRTEPFALELRSMSDSLWERETSWCIWYVFTGRSYGAHTAAPLLNNVHISISMNSNDSRQMQPLFPSFHSSSSPSSAGHLQRYRSHSSINNALAARCMRVTIPMLFSCRSTFPGLPVFLSYAAQTQAVYLLLPGSLRPAGMIASPSLFRRIKNLERQLTCRQYEARLSFPRFSSMQIHRCGNESRPRSTALG